MRRRNEADNVEYGRFQRRLPSDTHSADLVLPISDRILSSVDVRFNTLLWNRAMLSIITTQFGVTGHAPDFRVITAPPIRF
jgi:hypothetical protein